MVGLCNSVEPTVAALRQAGIKVSVHRSEVDQVAASPAQAEMVNCTRVALI